MSTHHPITAERLDTVLVVRLALSAAKPSTATELAKLTGRFAPPTLTAAQWRDQVEHAVQGLQAAQVITAERRLIRDDELARRLGPSSARKWEQWTERLLPAIALGIRPDDARALARLSIANGWTSAIVGRALGLWTDGPPPLLGALCDAVVWRALGLDGTPEPCPPRIRAHFLEAHIRIKQGKPAQLVRQIATQALDAPRSELAAIRDALVRRWLTGRAVGPELAAPSPDVAAASSSSEPAAPSLIEAARRVAFAARDGVFGERKVFISAVWRALREHPAWASLALDDFKARLVAAHRNQELVLARADLVAAMDPALVSASETRTDGATFHFIVREPDASR